METHEFKNLDEKIYITTLKNGFKIILYPTKKTKNFYATINVKYGAKVNSYKISGKKDFTQIINGTAHFLEHKVMDLSGEDDIMKQIEVLGSSVNAYTNYSTTCYNIYGSKDILTNIKILFDRVFTLKLTSSKVENEKGIISEEIDMYKDDPYIYIDEESNKNLFYKDYLKNNILGTKESIKTITKDYLYQVYNDFYTPSNMFSVITGDFNKEEVEEFIKTYIKNKNIKNKKIIIKKEKEKDNVKINYEELNKMIEIPKVNYSVKLNKNLFNIEGKQLDLYLSIIFQANFDITSDFYLKCIKNNLIINKLNFYKKTGTNHIILTLLASSKNPDDLIKELNKKLKKLSLKKQTFDRKKKSILNTLILSFENIEDICDKLIYEEVEYNRIITEYYEIVKNLDYESALNILETLDLSNISILKIIK